MWIFFVTNTEVRSLSIKGGFIMAYRIKRKLNATAMLLIIGFVISFTAVLIGISSVNSVLIAMKKTSQAAPVFDTMRQTGISLAMSIYAFSVVNCVVVTNYWIITRRRDMAVKKAFGWSNIRLLLEISFEMSELIFIGFLLSSFVLIALINWKAGLFSITLTPFFVIGTVALLIFTLIVSLVVPFTKIMKIRPAEVIS